MFKIWRIDSNYVALRKLLSAAMIWSGPGRLQSALAKDKLTGGPGLLPRLFPEEGLRQGVGWRIRQAAFDVINGERSSGSDDVSNLLRCCSDPRH